MDYRSLLDDMALALRSEFGARTFYRLRRRWTRDPELRGVLDRLAVEQDRQIAALRTLMVDLGGRPRRVSVRRWAGSLLVLLSAGVLGPAIGLRVCVDAEWTVARWYGQYRAWLLQVGEVGHAETCATLATTKQRHASALETWLEHSRGRRIG